jgi:peptide/nickel transport system substrate-binding protein
MAPHRLPPLSRRDLLKLGGALAATGVLGLQPGQSAADGDPGGAVTPKKRGGTFRFRLAQAPPHFDPHQTLAPSTMIALSFAYSRLMRSGAGATVVPGTQPVEGDLAESWDRQGDTTYVFKLRKGVQWQGRAPVNGRELVAQDVKYTYERFLAQPGNPNRALLEMVERVDAPDKYTVKFTLREPNAWFVDRLAATSLWIVARECVEKYGDLKKPESVVGTGPWVLDRYEPNAKLQFVRNPGYFLPGLPFVDAVEVTIDPDPVAAGAAFAAGKYDFGPEYGMTIRRSDLVLAKKSISRWLPTRELLLPAGRVTAMRLDKDPFKDVRARRAIAMADNWHEFLDRNPLAQGKGAPNPAIPAAFKDWSIRIKDLPAEGKRLYEPDPAAARKLLAEAGHADGIKVTAEATPGGREWTDAVEIAVKNWKAAGIDAEVKVKNAEAPADQMLLALRDGGTAIDPDVYFASLLPGHPLNTSGVNDPKLVEMIKLQRRTYKEGARRDIVHDIQSHCSQQVYYAYGASVSAVSAWAMDVKDFGPNIGHDYGVRLMVAWLDR